MSHEWRAPNLSVCPMCRPQKTDCFAYSDGRCKALEDTHFKNNVCPFYKNKRKVDEKWTK